MSQKINHEHEGMEKEKKARILFSWILFVHDYQLSPEFWFYLILFCTTVLLFQHISLSLWADAVIFNKSFRAMKHLAKVKNAVKSVEQRLNSYSRNTWRHSEMESMNKLFTALLIAV